MELLGLPAWLWWLMAAVALVLADLGLLGAQFILVATGLAALLAAGGAALGLGITGQVWTFVIGTLLLVPLMVRLLRKLTERRGVGPREEGWERGRRVTVVAQGDRLVAKLQSDLYPVALTDGSEPREGESLVVDRMEGITLITHRPDKS